jgi:hypothetical protein
MLAAIRHAGKKGLESSVGVSQRVLCATRPNQIIVIRPPTSRGYAWTMSIEIFLVADVGTLEVRPSGPATGGIWLVTESGAFPAAGWNDFIVVILSWWAGALLKTLRSNGDRVRVPFMDGPYAVDVAMSGGMLNLRLITRDREVGTAEAALHSFVSSLTSQSRKVLHACRSLEWWSADADTLESLLTDLERELAVLNRAAYAAAPKADN